MGLIVATTRMIHLQNQRLDLEYKIQLITATQSSLAQSTSDLLQVGNDFDPDSPASKMLAQRQAKLKVLEQKLQNHMGMYQNRLKMIAAEEDSCRQMMEKNIERMFKY